MKWERSGLDIIIRLRGNNLWDFVRSAGTWPGARDARGCSALLEVRGWRNDGRSYDDEN